jgi:hypothetical protein
MFEHFGNAQGPMLGVTKFLPQRPATCDQPDIESGQRAKALLARFLPDAPATAPRL